MDKFASSCIHYSTRSAFTVGDTFGSETYTVVYSRSCTIQFIIELVGLLLYARTRYPAVIT